MFFLGNFLFFISTQNRSISVYRWCEIKLHWNISNASAVFHQISLRDVGDEYIILRYAMGKLWSW